MKKFLCYVVSVIMLCVILTSAVYSEGETAVVRIQGEDDSVTTNFDISKRKIQDMVGADGGAWSLYQASGAETPQDGGSEFYVKFTFSIPKTGKYELNTSAGLTANWGWCGAPFSVEVNGGTPVSSSGISQELPDGASDKNALRYYNFGSYELSAGENTVVFKPLEKTGTGNYILFIDYVEFAESEADSPDIEEASSVLIEGENFKEYIGDAPTGTYIMTKSGAGGGRFLNYSSATDATKGFTLVYEFEIFETAEYNLYFTGASYSSQYLSKGKIKLDNGEFENIDAALFNSLGNSEVSGFESLIQHNVSRKSFYLEQGKHTIEVLIDNKREAGNSTYYYMIDCFEFVKDGILLSAEFNGDGGSLTLEGSLTGYAKGEVPSANVEFTALDPYIAVLAEDGTISANGDGNARFKAEVICGDKVYEAETTVKCYLGELEIQSAERTSDGVNIGIANHGENTKTVTLYGVRRGADGVAAEIVPIEVILNSDDNKTISLTFSQLDDTDMIDYFILGMDKKPLSLCHSLRKEG